MMGFSIDYEFVAGSPESDAEYFWIIEPSQGEPYAEAVQLSSKGALQTFVPWVKSDGPFRSYLGKGDGKGSYEAISAEEPMQGF